MPRSLLTRSCLLLFLTTCFLIAVESGTSTLDKYGFNKQLEPIDSVQNANIRVKRGFFGKKGFIRTLFSTAYEQWSDTKHTINSIQKQVNDNFLDENAPVTVKSAKSHDPNATTTEAPFKITRKEFSRIMRRNLKGIVRLFNLELKDALSVSKETERDFRKDATKQFSKFL